MDEKLRILLCEDDENLGMLLREYLQAKGYSAELFPDGEAGYKAFLKNKYDLCVFDVMMPKKDGFTLAQDVRAANAEIPIIFLTAKTLKEDILEGFKIGADDYITKPFSMEELTFRIEAILRRVRGKKNKESNIYKIGKFTFDTQKQILASEGKQTKLTTKESELLGLLCAHANEILQRDFALKTIWIDDNYFNARSMDVYITKLRILLCEDDENLGMLLREYLQAKGYSAELYPDGEAGYKAFLKNKYDLCVFDVMMPKKDGFTLAQDVRAANAEIPIIFLTAKTLKEDILEGFKIGADDYITKPFSMEELTFRIEAILRRVRGKKNKESNIYKIGKFTFDTQKQILSSEGKQTKLTTKESELLGLLCAHANEILQRDFALKTIWIDDNYFNARSMDVYITKLRKHLKEDDSIEIINIHGKGYKLITPEVES